VVGRSTDRGAHHARERHLQSGEERHGGAAEFARIQPTSPNVILHRPSPDTRMNRPTRSRGPFISFFESRQPSVERTAFSGGVYPALIHAARLAATRREALRPGTDRRLVDGARQPCKTFPPTAQKYEEEFSALPKCCEIDRVRLSSQTVRL
jgi:hypothetical protein